MRKIEIPNVGIFIKIISICSVQLSVVRPYGLLEILLKKVAPSNSTVLILGESGTGKELSQEHYIHALIELESTFVPVNCGAIPADLMESELFGHKKGALPERYRS